MRSEPNPYDRFLKEDLILRDQLALDRTILASERTMLAYVRTAFALVVVGLTAVQVFEETWLDVVGALLAMAGIILVWIGWRRYRRLHRQYQPLVEVAGEPRT